MSSAHFHSSFFAVNAAAGADSWLTVGITEGDSAGALSSVGIDWGTWTSDTGLTVDNGAVFWMSPSDGPSDTAVVAQLTVAGDFTAQVSAQVGLSARKPAISLST